MAWPVLMDERSMAKTTKWVSARPTNACRKNGSTPRPKRSRLCLFSSLWPCWSACFRSCRIPTTYDTSLPIRLPPKRRFWRRKTEQEILLQQQLGATSHPILKQNHYYYCLCISHLTLIGCILSPVFTCLFLNYGRGRQCFRAFAVVKRKINI